MYSYKHLVSLYPFLMDLRHSLRSWNRRHELQRLVVWAEGKRLDGPLRLYRAQLRQEEAHLMRCCIRARKAAYWAFLLHLAVYTLFPPPRVYHAGAASGYRRVVDPRWKQTYSMKA